MKPSDYEFAIGDKVITICGDVGHIVDICKCERCLERGFCEPTWRSDINHNVDWITIHDAERGFDNFYQIGKYRFNHTFEKSRIRSIIIEKEVELRGLKRQLQVMEDLERENEE